LVLYGAPKGAPLQKLQTADPSLRSPWQFNTVATFKHPSYGARKGAPHLTALFIRALLDRSFPRF
jgi:hypothetical protein